MEVVEEDD
jgi:hypothetical protein